MSENDEPTGHWSLWQARGRAHAEARDYAQASACYRAALDALPEADQDSRAGLLKELGDTRVRQSLYGEETAGCYAEAVRLLEADSGPDHPDVANVLNSEAQLYLLRGELARAEQIARRADDIMRRLFAGEMVPLDEIDDHTLAALRAIWRDTLFYLGEILRAQGRYGEAEPPVRELVALAEQDFGPEHPSLCELIGTLGVLCKYQGRYDEAEAIYARAWRIGCAHWGAELPQAAATLLYNRAGLLHARGRPAEGEPLCREALAIQQRTLPPGHPGLAITLGALAALVDAQGRYAEAESLYREVLSRLEAVFGPRHAEIALTLNNLASVLEYRGRIAEAGDAYRRALALREDLLGPEHPQTGTSLNNLAVFCRDHGHEEEAAACFHRARAVLEQALGTDHPHAQACREAQAALLLRRPELAASP